MRAIALLMLLACHAALAPTGRLRLVPDRAALAVEIHEVCVTAERVDVSFGSGVLVSEDDVLTAYHVVDCEGVALLTVILADDRMMAASVAWSDERHDLARVALATPALLDVHDPVVGLADGRVCAQVAFPRREQRCGEVTEVRDDGTTWGEVRFSAVVQPGNSGGGVYDEEGRLVGIVTSRVFCSLADGLMARLGQEIEACSGRAALVTTDVLGRFSEHFPPLVR